VPAKQDEARTTGEKSGEAHEPKSEEKRIADATVALAAITGVLAFFTALLWLATFRLARDAKRTADRQARETVESLKIAADTARFAGSTVATMQSAEAPYLFPELVRIKTVNVDRPMIVYRFRNYGRTPAVLNRFQDTTAFYDQLPPEPHFGESLISRPERETILGAGEAGTEIYCRLPVDTVGELHANFARGLRLYMTGRVGYEDVFGRAHMKWYCMQVTPTGDERGIRIRIAGGKSYNRLEQDLPSDE